MDSLGYFPQGRLNELIETSMVIAVPVLRKISGRASM